MSAGRGWHSMRPPASRNMRSPGTRPMSDKPTVGRIAFGLPEFCTSPRGGFMDMTTTAHTERSERQTTPDPTRRCGYCGESLGRPSAVGPLLGRLQEALLEKGSSNAAD
jgi:hypothetical protein